MVGHLWPDPLEDGGLGEMIFASKMGLKRFKQRERGGILL